MTSPMSEIQEEEKEVCLDREYHVKSCCSLIQRLADLRNAVTFLSEPIGKSPRIRADDQG